MSTAFDLPLDPATLAAARGGGRHALEAIYKAFERAVFTLARRMTNCPDAAQDVVQNTFLRAFRSLHQYRGEAPFGHWLRSVAATEALMHLRAGRRFLELFEPDAVEDASPAVEDVVNADLERALGLLPPVPRAVMWLYHVEGYTHPEIAALSGRSVSFSKSQLSRAHHKLRELLNPLPAPAAAPPIGMPERTT
ncbi:MAG TPA: sigma-70 family RNA polymerase sigma factor [Solimonas sp.]|nr:sigma-70 family RNA polymerase sigma factor [Solimonas sp.]